MNYTFERPPGGRGFTIHTNQSAIIFTYARLQIDRVAILWRDSATIDKVECR